MHIIFVNVSSRNVFDKSPIICGRTGKTNEEFRFLGQVAALALFADEALSRSYKRMLRDNVHFLPVVFDIAARVVQYLGPLGFSAMHVCLPAAPRGGGRALAVRTEI